MPRRGTTGLSENEGPEKKRQLGKRDGWPGEREGGRMAGERRGGWAARKSGWQEREGLQRGELDAYTGCTSTQTGSKLPCLSDEQNCMIECPTLCEIDRMPEGPTSSRDSDGVRVMFSHQTTPCPLDSPGIKANNADAQEPGHERRSFSVLNGTFAHTTALHKLISANRGCGTTVSARYLSSTNPRYYRNDRRSDK